MGRDSIKIGRHWTQFSVPSSFWALASGTKICELNSLKIYTFTINASVFIIPLPFTLHTLTGNGWPCFHIQGRCPLPNCAKVVRRPLKMPQVSECSHLLEATLWISRHNSLLEQKIKKTLQWCHSVCDSVSNHQPHECLLNRLFRRRSKKTCFHLMTSSWKMYIQLTYRQWAQEG